MKQLFTHTSQIGLFKHRNKKRYLLDMVSMQAEYQAWRPQPDPLQQQQCHSARLMQNNLHGSPTFWWERLRPFHHHLLLRCRDHQVERGWMGTRGQRSNGLHSRHADLLSAFLHTWPDQHIVVIIVCVAAVSKRILASGMSKQPHYQFLDAYRMLNT